MAHVVPALVRPQGGLVGAVSTIKPVQELDPGSLIAMAERMSALCEAQSKTQSSLTALATELRGLTVQVRLETESRTAWRQGLLDLLGRRWASLVAGFGAGAGVARVGDLVQLIQGQ